MSALPMPLSAEELRESVRQCRAFDPARLSRVLRIDRGRGLIEVQGATPWTAIADALRPGDALARGLPTTRRTVGESVAWNAAGPDGRPVVVHLDSLTVVTPDGSLRRVDRITSPALFGLVVGGQGLFGVLYSVSLRIESLARAVNDAAGAEAPASAAKVSSASWLRLLVPPERLDELRAEVLACCRDWHLSLAGTAVRRIHAERDTYLRWAPRDYVELSVALDAPERLGGAVRATQARRELISAALGRGGGFPIACTREATRSQAEACYPQLAAFLAEQRRIDPADRMANGWLRHYRSLLARDACEVRWGR